MVQLGDGLSVPTLPTGIHALWREGRDTHEKPRQVKSAGAVSTRLQSVRRSLVALLLDILTDTLLTHIGVWVRGQEFRRALTATGLHHFP